MCHGEEGHGAIGPSVVDDVFLGQPGDLPDGAYFRVIHDGTEENGKLADRRTEGGMPPFGGQMTKEDVWSIVSYLRATKAHEKSETPTQEAAEHGRKQP
jgi:mono/diheme cytochrome c family protein